MGVCRYQVIGRLLCFCFCFFIVLNLTGRDGGEKSKAWERAEGFGMVRSDL